MQKKEATQLQKVMTEKNNAKATRRNNQAVSPIISKTALKDGTRSLNVVMPLGPTCPILLDALRSESQQVQPRITKAMMTKTAEHFAQTFRNHRAVETIVKEMLKPEASEIENDKELLKLYADQNEEALFDKSKTAILPHNVTITQRTGKSNYDLSQLPLPHRIDLITKFPEAFTLTLTKELKADEERMAMLENCPTITSNSVYSVTVAPNAKG